MNFEQPLFQIHLNVDYPFNLTGILYFPKLKNKVEVQRDKIQLYSNQVFVTDSVEGIVPDFLMLRGAFLAGKARTREDLMRASWPFLRVAIHFPDDPRAADGYYEAARLLERIDLSDHAAVLMRACLDHEGVSESTRAKASGTGGFLSNHAPVENRAWTSIPSSSLPTASREAPLRSLSQPR